MNEKNARVILEIDEYEKLTEVLIKKKYRNKALKCHPDKNKSSYSNDQFLNLKNAYDYLNEKTGIEVKTNSYSELLYDFLKERVQVNKSSTNTTATNTTATLLNIIIEKLSNKCEEKMRNIVETIDKEVLIYIYKLIIGNDAIFRHLDESIMEKLKNAIDERSKNDELIILNPTIEDLIEFNVFKCKISGQQLLIPLWHRELTYDISNSDIHVKCNPVLNDDYLIDDDNNLHIKLKIKLMDIWNTSIYKFAIGKKEYELEIDKLQMRHYQLITLNACGIPRINTINIYDINELGNIEMHIHIEH